MQNPIWKLTALAGVIGIGFLIVYQAQTASDPTDHVAATVNADPGLPAEDSSALSYLDSSHSEDRSGDFLSHQNEPGGRGAGTEWDQPDGQNSEPPFRNFGSEPDLIAGNSEPGRGSNLLPSDADIFADSPGEPELDPFLAEPSRTAAPDLFAGSESDNSESDNSESDNGIDALFPSNRELTNPAITPTDLLVESQPPVDKARQQAVQLMKEARAAIDRGDLRGARSKAMAASALPVIYDSFELRPADLLVEIDELIAAAGLKIQTIEPDPPAPFTPDRILPVSGLQPLERTSETAFPADSLPTEKPALSPFGDLPDPGSSPDTNFFADNKPVDSPISLADPADSPIDMQGDENPFPQEPADLSDGGPAEFDSFDSLPVEPLNAATESATTPNPESFDTTLFPAADPPAPVTTESRPTPAPRLASRTSGIDDTGLIGNIALPTNAPLATQRQDLTIEKVAPADAEIGKPIIYSITVVNRGDATATNVVVEDHIPKGCRLVGTIPQAELIGTKLLWRLGRIPTADQRKVLIKVVPVEEGEIGSVATVNFMSEVSSKTEVRPALSPAVSFRTTAPENATVGELVKFHFAVINEGQIDLENVKLQNLIPAGLEHTGGSDLTYEIGRIPAGKSFEVDLEMLARSPGRHSNKAIIRTGSGLTVESIRAVNVINNKALKLSASSTGRPLIGETSTQTIVIANESPAAVAGAKVTMNLAEQLEFASASNGGLFDGTTRSIQWQLPAIPAGQSMQLKVTAIPTRFGVHASSVELVAGSQKTVRMSEVEARGIAALKLDLDNVPATIKSGEEFTIDITLRNRGNGPDNNVTLAVSLPAELEFVNSHGPVRHQTPVPALSGNRIAFKTIPEIGEQASVDFQMTLRARQNGRPKIHAEVSSDQLGQPLVSEAAVAVLAAP